MTKIFLIISSVVLLVAAVFGVQNRSEFIETRTQKDQVNRDIKAGLKRLNDTAIPELKDKQGVLKDTLATLKETNVEIDTVKRNIQAKDLLITDLSGRVSPLRAKKAEYEQVIRDFKVTFPGVDTIEDVVAQVEVMEQQILAANQEAEQLDNEIKLGENRVTTNRNAIKRFQTKQSDRAVGIERNALEGVITAVNNDWGFVIINAGKNKGVTADSTLIVKRGNENIGTLTINSIEDRLTVANINLKTLAKGTKIKPGDRVIFKQIGS